MRPRPSPPPPRDNIDEVFILNAAALLPGGEDQLRVALQSGRLETIVRSPAGDEAPGPRPAFWKSTAGEEVMSTTGWAEVIAPHPLAQAFCRGHVFVTRTSMTGILTARHVEQDGGRPPRELERAMVQIRALFPQGVPAPGELSHAELERRVRVACERAKLTPPSLRTVKRAREALGGGRAE